MGRFVEGEYRSQSALLLGECLDDWVTEHKPVRVVDVFVDRLDLTTLGFDRMHALAIGRPNYRPAKLLEIGICGCLNRMQSSRRLECLTQRVIESMWLTGRLAPECKTINVRAPPCRPNTSKSLPIAVSSAAR